MILKMVSAEDETVSSSDFNVVLDSLNKAESSASLSKEDLDHLKSVLENDRVKQIAKAHDVLIQTSVRGQRQDCIATCKDIMMELESVESKDDNCVNELFKIMDSPYFRALIEAHDNALYQTYVTPPVSPLPDSHQIERVSIQGPPIRVVGLTKTSVEPLGITLGKHKDQCIYIQRILYGSMVEKQGLLNVGDVIKEINGEPVGAKSAEEVQQELNSCVGSISMKVIPSYKDHKSVCQVFLKAHFDYDPLKDVLLPKGEQGLTFCKGDILEVVDQADLDWWQATRVDRPGKMGVIPSLRLEQTRRATISSSHKEAKLFGQIKKKKIIYETSKNAIFDKFDIPIYEEVTKMPPFERKTIALIGAQHVGRRTIKNRLVSTYPDRFATPLPDTSRPIREGERNGVGYNFIDKATMDKDIKEGKYLEWGNHNGNFYGTRIEEVRNINKAGKVCIIDCNPSALKVLKTAEFMPLIVFIKCPSLVVLKRHQMESNSKKLTDDQLKDAIRESATISESYEHFFDVQIVNDDKEVTFSTIRNLLEECANETQWVPVHWVY